MSALREYVEVTLLTEEHSSLTYFDEKRRRNPYNAAKIALLGPQGPFSGWLGNHSLRRELFDAQGVVIRDTTSSEDLQSATASSDQALSSPTNAAFESED